jgi:hypothetical protein
MFYIQEKFNLTRSSMRNDLINTKTRIFYSASIVLRI